MRETGGSRELSSVVVRVAVAGALALAASVALPGVSNAFTAQPRWALTTTVAPSSFAPGDSSGRDELELEAVNVGNAAAEAPVTITDKLPAGLTAVSIQGEGAERCVLASLTCVFATGPRSARRLAVVIHVDVDVDTPASLLNEASVSGGGSFPVSASDRIPITSVPVSFGIERYALTATDEDGAPDPQAGSHPYELTAEVGLNQTLDSEGEPTPVGSVRDLHFELPPGLSIDPDSVLQCSEVEFVDEDCPNSTAVGVALVSAGGEIYPASVYDLAPALGEPLRLGFFAEYVPLEVNTAIRTGGDYGITASIRNATEVVSIDAIRLTLWGVPEEASHDALRGTCLTGGGTNCTGGAASAPYLTMPTSCAEGAQTTISADSWQEPGASQSATSAAPAMSGCELLAFEPAIEVATNVAQPDQPAGYELAIQLRQDEAPAGLATSELENASITMPDGVLLSPAGLDGLAGCSEAQIALASAQPGSCPESSRVGTVELALPFLSNPVNGYIYWAAEDANPFGSAMALYLEADDPATGILVKLPVEVDVNPLSGQLALVLEKLPQLPFSGIVFEFFSGPQALLLNPPQCGVYAMEADLSPWSRFPEVTALSSPLAVEGCSSPPGASPAPLTKPSTTTTTTGAEEQQQNPPSSTQSPSPNTAPATSTQQKSPSPRPSVSHIRVRRSGDRLLVTFTTSAAGAITLSGVGIRRHAEDVLAGAHEIRLVLNRRGKASRRERRPLELELVLKSATGSVSAHFAWVDASSVRR